jgi:hypothetical protein
MGSRTERGQILIECAMALLFLILVITVLQNEWKQKQFKKTIEGKRIYKFQTYSKEVLK